MKVTLATHGGQAAGIRLAQPARVVDTADLTDGDAAELARLVAATRSEAAGPDSSRGRARDAMSYTITVEEEEEEEGGSSTALSRSDTTMTRSFADLLAWLEQHAPSP